MPEISDATHQRILEILTFAHRALREKRAKSRPPTGYVGYDLVESQLLECRAVMEKTKDRDGLVNLMQQLAFHAKQVGGGDVLPVVERLIAELRAQWEALEPESPPLTHR